MYLEIDPSLAAALPKDGNLFEWFLEAKGTTHRKVKHRLTYETQVGDQHVFVKRHLGCGWGEVFKEWYRLRKPVVSARTEWAGAEILSAAGLRVPTVLGKGERGRYPNKMESFVVLGALEDHESLEYFRRGWLGVDGPRWVTLKRSLVTEVAGMCRTMHRCGINHRDLYINHFLIARECVRAWLPGAALPLYLIDLHRVQKRARMPRRWLVKDLSSLLFSALDAGLTAADCLRFLRVYLGQEWKAKLRHEARLWQKIVRRAVHLYQGFHGTIPTLPKLLKNQIRP